MRLLTAKQTAEILQVSIARVYELARIGLLPCVRLGRQVRFDESILREWIARGGSIEKR
jgi:excisionase family DNA binding protein